VRPYHSTVKGAVAAPFTVTMTVLYSKHFATSQKCPYGPYHVSDVTFDLDLDLEHILDAGPSGDHGVQVWSRSSLCLVEEAICAKCLQTDGQTDGRRTPHDCISS